jgi:hypothetical protein
MAQRLKYIGALNRQDLYAGLYIAPCETLAYAYLRISIERPRSSWNGRDGHRTPWLNGQGSQKKVLSLSTLLLQFFHQPWYCIELFGMGTPQLVRMRVNWGRRRGARDGPATRPPSKSVAATAEDPFATFDPYPLFYIYHTQEQALTEHAIRTRSKDGYISPPLPD